MDFKNETSFREFVYNNICQCFNQCIDLKENTFKNKQPVCSEITNLYQEDEQDKYYNNIITNAIEFFVNEDIIFKNGVRYYLTENNTRFTWDNIKNLTDTSNIKLLWLLRKLIVDCLLKSLLNSDINLKIFSVGSTNLSSDYDITLYGDDQDKIDIINAFNKKFYDIFSESSSIVFDTNIYGRAYIAFSENDFGSNGLEIECNNQKFFYLKNGEDNSQLCWALIKYINDIRDSFGENIYNNLIDFMKDKLNSTLINYATIIRRTLKNKDESFNYSKMLRYKDKIVKCYEKSDELTGYNDYISLVNFYGIETYFTRGAFLDIVVNEQMCRNETIKLSDVDLLSSILENAGFFFNHNNKTKYFIRIYKTLEKLIKQNDLYNIQEFIDLENIVKSLEVIDDTGKINYDTFYCKWIDNEKFDLLKCEKYQIFNILFKLIFKLLKVYTTNNTIQDSDFIFYNKFIDNNNSGDSIAPTKIPYIQNARKYSRKNSKTILPSQLPTITPSIIITPSIMSPSTMSPKKLIPSSPQQILQTKLFVRNRALSEAIKNNN
jgi:hypothetical protein